MIQGKLTVIPEIQTALNACQISPVYYNFICLFIFALYNKIKTEDEKGKDNVRKRAKKLKILFSRLFNFDIAFTPTIQAWS